MRTQHPAQHSMTFLATACVAAAALLTGCSSSGGGSGINPRPNGGGGTEAQVTPGPKSPQGSEPTPTAEVAHGAAHTVVAAGDAISEIGKDIRHAPIPVLPGKARYGLGGVVDNTGDAVSALGDGLHEGLGQMGHVRNPVGITVASTGNVVEEGGEAVISAGKLVYGLGTGQLAPLSPVTTPVGKLVKEVGHVVKEGGHKLFHVLSEGPVENVTGAVSKVIVPLTSKLTDGTQKLGAVTGLGKPVDGLLRKLGYTVAGGGSLLGHSDAPLVAPLGGVFKEAGMTVAAAGGLVNGGHGHGGNPLGGLLGNLPLLGGHGGAHGGGQDGNPVGGLLGSLPLLGGSHGDGHGGSSGLLAPVTGLLGGLAGGDKGGGHGGGHGGKGGKGGDSDGKGFQLPLLGGLLR
ncbi:collagen-like triple helix repeat-containing protein [Cupriavidus oxalaticus]|uniref:Collagen-like triple helix repeat-containing protein n=1 Tax=Cupriavidus oxalaticus TaxID=96344 RepID=A0A375GCH2_9BURK|nr:collagen-like triple helix repeat-containing protein [Cupriavidus oxalaticus]QRQ84393.1 collagen-like triple helix repeat-containing protein [Cupriavidus oxalaticus]QRQ91520.1 collagen-like triple helix repeat-containing protein [Cupriavidus oxalaticus]WQD86090.1 collagen-like triple helix repeat-containing protein [Cupriavidus oxalaticus]SPC10572.1 Hemagglutinin transmembrane protein [Cupriavidus oxalaticus]SPC19618.1 Hemagglutinin transmembrane protein [Cupriavidus oxalaticus]